MNDIEGYYRRNAHIDRLGNLFRLYGYGLYSIEGYEPQSIWRIMAFDAEEHMDHTIVVSGCWGWSIEEWLKAIKKKL